MKPLLHKLEEIYPDSPKARLKSWIRAGRVFVDGKRVQRAMENIADGAEITLGKREETLGADVRLLFEDAHIIVVDKPTNLLTVTTDNKKAFSLHDLLKRRKGPIYPVHRLDRETSGPLVFAYTQEAREALQEQFAKRSVAREYIAIVEGEMAEESGTWESHLYEDGALYVRSSPTKGKKAITHFHVIRRGNGYTMLRVRLETGRRNQIRVHCADAGHPIAGDRKYGGSKSAIGRLALHATHLAFTHPITGKQLSFSIKEPNSFLILFN